MVLRHRDDSPKERAASTGPTLRKGYENINLSISRDSARFSARLPIWELANSVVDSGRGVDAVVRGGRLWPPSGSPGSWVAGCDAGLTQHQDAGGCHASPAGGD